MMIISLILDLICLSPTLIGGCDTNMNNASVKTNYTLLVSDLCDFVKQFIQVQVLIFFKKLFLNTLGVEQWLKAII